MDAPLPDEIIDHILLGLPPSDPGSLVCRGWRRLLSGPAFRRRFREHHRSPPMLGRVLYYDGESVPLEAPVRVDLVVSHPITGEERRLTTPLNLLGYCTWSGALLCATPGCAHLDCPPGGPFAVVFVGTDESEEHTRAYHYSSESGKWSKAASVAHPTDRVAEGRSALVGNAVYFIWEESNGILEYDLDKQELSVISLPPVCEDWFVALMAAEDGGLGFAIVKDFKLHMWSREPAGANVGSGWAQRRVVELKSVAPDRALSTLPASVIPFANGYSVIFAFTRDVGVFSIDMRTGLITKVCKVGAVHGIVPCICFYRSMFQVMATHPLAYISSL
ncbi:uncharacterized protein [Setaria viridis]|uniref:F-box protein AT5G49610-like beta-propeller domain-containing protein n=1 Tax=Setaria viridis TaxID=4556 RepID=A0A4U6TZZ9_SETVI|nr:uncharacterized protein LOC117860790 [Setaria viridis]TKW08710.1 hypothetical protein SEVIR_6G041800v2 [Setaria viridis]